jgi:hypothetical protein
MRTLVGFGFPLLLATGLFAQQRGSFGNPHPFPQGTFGSGVLPAGAARMSGTVTRPGPGRQPSLPGERRTGTAITYWYPVFYGYPVYVGGYADNINSAEPAPQQPPDSDITVNDATQPARAVIQYFGSDHAKDPTTPTAADDFLLAEEPASTTESSRYLIAFKDRSIYSAVAYWVDGDTLHYFTSGNTHNQASVSLVDRDLTERLNKESGLEVKLPSR